MFCIDIVTNDFTICDCNTDGDVIINNMLLLLLMLILITTLLEPVAIVIFNPLHTTTSKTMALLTPSLFTMK